MSEIDDLEYIKKFAQIYIDGSACENCKYEPCQECELHIDYCAKQIKNLIK